MLQVKTFAFFCRFLSEKKETKSNADLQLLQKSGKWGSEKVVLSISFLYLYLFSIIEFVLQPCSMFLI